MRSATGSSQTGTQHAEQITREQAYAASDLHLWALACHLAAAAVLVPGDDDALDAEFVDQDADADEQRRTPGPVRDAIRAQAIAHEGDERPADQPPHGVVAGTLGQLFPSTSDRTVPQAAHYSLGHHLFGKTTTKELNRGECQALLDWAQERKAGGEWLMSDHAIAEASVILQAVGAANGQQGMF